MIIWIIAAFVLLTFLSLFMIPKAWLRYLLTALFGGLTVVSVALLTANMDSHFGMEKTTTTTTKQVYAMTPEQSPIKAVTSKKIGRDNAVLVYKDQPSDKEAKAHFAPDTKNMVATSKIRSSAEKTNTSSAQVKTVITNWTYKSDFWEFLFAHKNDDNTVSVRHHLQVPENWQIIEK
ncbi:DUF4811 domain-containing protein [Fructobacillus sp. M1-13]|uniref:DUF4811 domain-containing protein n=1 Tax=Fructobacillus papyriferae TaxID=2713171 RepID=A0ABS5QSI9_9LACO|nr:DUF4811 domain-containing protein [Fructobacillus papyriferae]MBS9335279.1 DUF4811 domain-containing protein [Fructobacillus papyriferae]MCD2159052.1 DUF4811 domain-containing protein [Fructobacillus papyriferae]